MYGGSNAGEAVPDAQAEIVRKGGQAPPAPPFAIWERLKSSIKWLSGISVFYRLMLGTVAGALGGSGFITFINKYAMYWYAYSYGCRVPVEGIPYLSLAVSAVSFAFLSLALLSSTGTYYTLVGLSALIEYVLGRSDSIGTPGFKSLWKKYGTVFVNIVSFSGYIFIKFYHTPLAISFPTMLITTTLLTVVIFWPSTKTYIALFYTCFLILLLSLSLFIPSIYAAMLRQGRFGGGVEITIIRREGTIDAKHEATHLFLATSEQLITFDIKTQQFVEIPRDDVKMIRYSTDRQYALPRLNSKDQNQK